MVRPATAAVGCSRSPRSPCSAAVLRLVSLAKVPDTPFYDAAVRSMSLSWHNFFYGAFDPTASASVDKPPIDLWIQVLTVKLIGFSSTALKLPSAIAASARRPPALRPRPPARRPDRRPRQRADARRPAGRRRHRPQRHDGLADDGPARRSTPGSSCATPSAASSAGSCSPPLVLGLDFNVKLFEALVPRPGVPRLPLDELATAIGLRQRLAGSRRPGSSSSSSRCPGCRRLPDATHDRPYPVGSTNGSVWNAVFVYNGTDRLTRRAASRPASATSSRDKARRATNATNAGRGSDASSGDAADQGRETVETQPGPRSLRRARRPAPSDSSAARSSTSAASSGPSSSPASCSACWRSARLVDAARPTTARRPPRRAHPSGRGRRRSASGSLTGARPVLLLRTRPSSLPGGVHAGRGSHARRLGERSRTAACATSPASTCSPPASVSRCSSRSSQSGPGRSRGRA